MSVSTVTSGPPSRRRESAVAAEEDAGKLSRLTLEAGKFVPLVQLTRGLEGLAVETEQLGSTIALTPIVDLELAASAPIGPETSSTGTTNRHTILIKRLRRRMGMTEPPPPR